MSDDVSSNSSEAPKVEATKDVTMSECPSTDKISVNGDNADSSTVKNTMNGDSCSATNSPPEADDEKIDEMFTDDMVNEMKEELGDGKDEFTDQCDQKDSEALEMKIKDSEKNEALQLFHQGKRNLLIKDYDAAVETLAAACEKFSSIYGELDVECGDVFMTYGHALVEMWRYEESNKKEDDDLNGTNKSVGNEDVKDENAVTETNGEQNVEENEEVTEPVSVEAAASGGETEQTEEQGTNDDDEDGETAPPNDDTIEDENTEDNNDDDDPEEIDNLQLAWEIFETAKNIYTKVNDETNLAKVHLKLGEISIASGNYETAIEDLKRTIALLNKSPTPKPRQIADAHFQLYSAYSANYNFDLAEIEIRNAKNILEEQLGVLNEKLTHLTAANEETKQINAEIKDLEELTKDMREKLLELNSSKRQVMNAILQKMENRPPSVSNGEMAGSSGLSLPASLKSSSNVPVNNISHLVRKKPKDAGNDKVEEQAKMTNGSSVENLKEDLQMKAKEIVKSDVSTSESPKCKRKAEDESEKAGSSAKKQCVNQD